MRKRAADLKYRQARRAKDKEERETKPPEQWIRKGPEQAKKKETALKTAKKAVSDKAKKAGKKLLKTLRGVIGEDRKDERRKAKEMKNLHREAKKLDREWRREIEQEERERRTTYKNIEVRSNSNKKFTTNFDTYAVKIEGVFRDPSDIFLDCIKLSIKKHDIQPGDKVRLIIHHPSWYKPFSTKLLTVPKGEITRKLIEGAIMFAEYKAVPINELNIEVQTTKIPRGAGILPTTKANTRNGDKQCIITIKNSDEMCLARAMVTAHALNNPDRWTKTQIKDGFCKSRKLQTEQAELLHHNADVTTYEGGNTLDDCKKFAKYLNTQVRVFSCDEDNVNIGDPILNYSPHGKVGAINILKDVKHFNVIRSLTAFLGVNYYCQHCDKGHDKKNRHKCPGRSCNHCWMVDDCVNTKLKEIFCAKCNRVFNGKKCFNNHLKDKSTKKDAKPDIACEKYKKCLKCTRLIHLTLKGHVCGHDTCSNCKKYCDLTKHRCFMTKRETKGGKCTKIKENGGMWCEEAYPDKREKWKRCLCCRTRTTAYLFVDFESTQEKDFASGYKPSVNDKHHGKNRKVHEVNFVRSETFYGEKRSYKDIDEFCTVLTNEYLNHHVIAHNGGAYDFKFIQAWFINQGKIPSIIANGPKIMEMSVSYGRSGGLRFIDSINFVASPLADFPKIFGLEEKKKGYFPHGFNKKENQNYVGPMPPRDTYWPGYMKPEVRKKFIKWYNERVKEKYVFDMRKEIDEYCESDVDILAAGMKNLRENFLKLGNIDPLQYTTIASVCINLYRSKYMPEKKIAVFKPNREEAHSGESIKWLKWIESKDGVKILHANNGKEHQIKGVGRVDGYCKQTHTAYEYQGCFWHGCGDCYRNEHQANPVNAEYMKTLRDKTEEKNEKIRNAGYNLVEVWECKLRNDNAFKEWKKSNNIEVITPINPRDAFFGGRTNITKMLYDFEGTGDTGAYKDFCSLYPSTNLRKEYPVGHPMKIYEPSGYNNKWFGLVKCKVLPPRGLYHPVLPMKAKCGDADKLLFPLCRTCAQNHHQGTCQHSDEERSITGTWCTPEMEVAISKGYIIKKIHEVWHFNERTTDLFTDYVKDFAKLKIESSKSPLVGPGHPYESLDDFRKKIWERDGIRIGEIKHNPGMRQIAKLCLNSLWGKFGQRTNKSQDLYINNVKRFYGILLNDTLEDVTLTFMSDEIVHVNYKLRNEFVDQHNNINIFVAAFTTSHARCTLYGLLDTLGDRVLGYDTDSAWYVVKKGEKDPIKTGDMLGDLTDELEGGRIVEWVGSGPKSYAYKNIGGENGDENKCKLKGFTLNFDASQHINIDSMKKVVQGEIKEIVVAQNRITRDDTTLDIITELQEKTFSRVYDKRVIQSNYDTLPYGY